MPLRCRFSSDTKRRFFFTCCSDEGLVLIQMLEEGFTCRCDEGVSLIQGTEESFYLYVVSMKV